MFVLNVFYPVLADMEEESDEAEEEVDEEQEQEEEAGEQGAESPMDLSVTGSSHFISLFNSLSN